MNSRTTCATLILSERQRAREGKGGRERKYINNVFKLDSEAHACNLSYSCNPSYSGGGYGKTIVQDQPG
jgi:hypothetical protein